MLIAAVSIAAVLEHESAVRLGAFASVFVVFALFERVRPRRAATAKTGRRWLGNAAMFAIDVALVRILVPAGVVGVALQVEPAGLGLLARVDLAPWLEVLIAVIALDLAVWSQHVAFHKVPFFWRFHEVHHADLDLDVSSGIRFHPVEMLFSVVWKGAVVFLLGASPAAVIVFEVVLNGMSLATHANARLGLRLDAALRHVLVTPDMHRIHHSVVREETDSNYGFSLAIWDRLFRTYRAQPAAGQEGMTIGLERHRDPRAAVRLAGMLRMPFVR